MIKQPSRVLGGSGKMAGLPPMSMFTKVVELIKEALNSFSRDVTKAGISNENALNRRLAIVINNISRHKDMPFLAGSEAMEVETNGNSPAADIGIFLRTDDVAITPPKITVFEGKRLTTDTGTNREREYVVGNMAKRTHSKCGGIQRFKCSIHGRDFNIAGMIGYIQDGTSAYWLRKINAWIAELCDQEHSPKWNKKEQLIKIDNAKKVSEYSSVAFRETDSINLTHLWVDLCKNN